MAKELRGLGIGAPSVTSSSEPLVSLDALSDGRIHVGVGGGWLLEEMANHGTDPATRFRRLRESVEALRIMMTEDPAEYHGRIIDFDPIHLLPKPATCPKIHVAGSAPRGLERALRYGDGWIPLTGRGNDDFVALAEEKDRAQQAAGREIEYTVYNAPGDPAVLDGYRDAGIDRALLLLFPGDDDQTRAQLDRYAELVSEFGPDNGDSR